MRFFNRSQQFVPPPASALNDCDFEALQAQKIEEAGIEGASKRMYYGQWEDADSKEIDPNVYKPTDQP